MSRAERDRAWGAVPLHPSEPPAAEGHPLDLDHLDATTEAQVMTRRPIGGRRADDKEEPRPSCVVPQVGRGFRLVELRGFEPLTFSLRTRRATNCATAPWCGRNDNTRGNAAPNRSGTRVPPTSGHACATVCGGMARRARAHRLITIPHRRRCADLPPLQPNSLWTTP